MTIAETHRIAYLVLDKNREGFLKREDLDDLLDTAQLGYFAQLIGSLKRQIPMVGTNQVMDKLRPFRKKLQYLNVPLDAFNQTGVLPDGILVLPDDYECMGSMTTWVDGLEYPMEPLDDETWGGRTSSTLLTPDETCGIFKMEEGNIKILPVNVSGYLRYYRRPVKPLFKYSVVNRVETQDVAGSVDMEWSEIAMFDIIKRALELAGTKLDDTMLYQAMAVEESKE